MTIGVWNEKRDCTSAVSFSPPRQTVVHSAVRRVVSGGQHCWATGHSAYVAAAMRPTIDCRRWQSHNQQRRGSLIRHSRSQRAFGHVTAILTRTTQPSMVKHEVNDIHASRSKSSITTNKTSIQAAREQWQPQTSSGSRASTSTICLDGRMRGNRGTSTGACDRPGQHRAVRERSSGRCV